ncbi:MAG: hypothetical protein A4E58_00227 [Syntrophorhabdus sp. PtaB.Bin006]|nr:MAG: hypothetical protein A4E58_00227 [Syntrophorhabdus sp. PtaB.Bin006]
MMAPRTMKMINSISVNPLLLCRRLFGPSRAPVNEVRGERTEVELGHLLLCIANNGVERPVCERRLDLLYPA